MIDDLDRLLSLPTDERQSMLHHRLDLPQVRRLTHKQRAIRQARKEVSVMGPKVAVDIFVRRVLEVFPAQFDGDDFLIGQGRRESAATNVLIRSDFLILFTYEAIHGDDKLVSIH
jgi:hypothetical protein